MQGWPLLRKINPHRQQHEHNDPDDHRYFFARAIRRTLTRQGKFAMLGSLPYPQSVHLTKKCEEADVFTK